MLYYSTLTILIIAITCGVMPTDQTSAWWPSQLQTITQRRVWKIWQWQHSTHNKHYSMATLILMYMNNEDKSTIVHLCTTSCWSIKIGY